jgi:SAM-dependent methyltransferase
MSTETIQRQYDEVIAAHYDRDPQDVTKRSLDRAVTQLKNQKSTLPEGEPLRVLDVGIGTGEFLCKLRNSYGQPIQPFGLDLSARMVDAARKKLPDLVAEVDDAVNLDSHFSLQSFDLVCTHFITGFVPMAKLAGKIHNRLADGGYWSFVGGTQAGFRALRAKAARRPLCWVFGGHKLAVDELVCNPSGPEEVAETLENQGFVIRERETFEPKLHFRDLNDFMDFGYRGGWLTPFIEALGLHQAGAFTSWVLNTFLFPADDQHSIEIVLAQKTRQRFPGR